MREEYGVHGCTVHIGYRDKNCVLQLQLHGVLLLYEQPLNVTVVLPYPTVSL